MARNKSRSEARAADARPAEASPLDAIIPEVPAPLLETFAALPSTEHVAEAFVAHYRASLVREAEERSRPAARAPARPSAAPLRPELLAAVESLRSPAPAPASTGFAVAVEDYAAELAAEPERQVEAPLEDPFGDTGLEAHTPSESVFGDDGGLFGDSAAAPSVEDASVFEVAADPFAAEPSNAEAEAAVPAEAEPEAVEAEPEAQPEAPTPASEPKSRKSRGKRPR